jgi:hypothetical protein
MRFIASGLIFLLLSGCAVLAVMHGAASEQFLQLARTRDQLWRSSHATGITPDQATVNELEQVAARAIALAPSHGWLRVHQLYLARMPRQQSDGLVTENTDLARAAAEAAVVRHPHSPVAWAGYALLADQLHSRNQLEGGSTRLNQVIRRAITLGPREPDALLAMINLALRNWETLDAETRLALDTAITTLTPLHSQAIFAQALDRGRVTELCGHPRWKRHGLCAGQAGSQAQLPEQGKQP